MEIKAAYYTHIHPPLPSSSSTATPRSFSAKGLLKTVPRYSKAQTVDYGLGQSQTRIGSAFYPGRRTEKVREDRFREDDQVKPWANVIHAYVYILQGETVLLREHMHIQQAWTCAWLRELLEASLPTMSFGVASKQIRKKGRPL